MSNNKPTSAVPASVQTAIAQAEKHFQAGQLADCEKLLRGALKIQPNNADALFALGLVAYRAGKIPSAIELIEEAIEINPEAARFHTNIAAMFESQGQFDRAIEHGRAAVRLKPRQSEAHNNLGVALLAKGEPLEAIGHFSTAIECDPRNTDAMCNRARAYAMLHRHLEAEADARRAMELKPNDAVTLNALASALISKGDLLSAEGFVRKALVVRPGDSPALHNLILCLRAQKRFDEALVAAEQTLQHFPTSGEAMSLAASIYLDMRNLGAASRMLNKALAMNPDYVEAVVTLGRLQMEELKHVQAIESFQRAIELQRDHSEAHNFLGAVYRTLGRFDEALQATEQAIKYGPKNISAYANLAEIKTFTSRQDPRLDKMLKLRDEMEQLNSDQQIQLHFAIGKAFDDLDCPDEAFPHFAQGAAIKRAGLAYSEGETLGLFERIKTEFTAEVVQRLSGHGAETQLPIYVFGMPRSGTTLVEQMLASHPMVKGAGEIRVVYDAMGEFRARVPNNRAYPELLRDVRVADLQFLALSVTDRLSHYWPQALRITDKMTTNYPFLGILHLAMPKAKFVHVRRNPVDTCLSCFSKYFVAGASYSYEVGELARYYKGYAALMEHWREVLPQGAFIDVDYEELVGDFETQSKRILDYCELAWDPGVLSFYKTERAVQTASAAQVRQPLFSTSVGRWRKYEKHLGPLLNELGPLTR